MPNVAAIERHCAQQAKLLGTKVRVLYGQPLNAAQVGRALELAPLRGGTASRSRSACARAVALGQHARCHCDPARAALAHPFPHPPAPHGFCPRHVGAQQPARPTRPSATGRATSTASISGWSWSRRPSRSPPNGSLALADEQPPPALAPESHGEPGKSSLRTTPTCWPMKPSTDVTLVGSAYAPEGKARGERAGRLRFGTVDKSLVVHGARVYERAPVGLALSPPQTVRQASDPLRAGLRRQRHQRIPTPEARASSRAILSARGFASTEHALAQPAHALEYSAGPRRKLGPAGFGPSTAAGRRAVDHAGTYDGAWFRRRSRSCRRLRRALRALRARRSAAARPHARRRADRAHQPEPGGPAALDLAQDLPHLRHAASVAQVEEHRSKLATVILEPDQRRLRWSGRRRWRCGRATWSTSTHTTIAEKPYLT